MSEITFREQPVAADAERVRKIIAATGFFTPAEVAVAVELVEERLQRGLASGYEFVFAEANGQLHGYACYGHISVTASSYDLYWIAVDPARQRGGLGRRILQACEDQIAARGGTRIYIETSGRALYTPTQSFYTRAGYALEATLADFYAPGDAKLIYSRQIGR